MSENLIKLENALKIAKDMSVKVDRPDITLHVVRAQKAMGK